MASPAIDGSAKGNFTNASSGSATLTTAQAGDAVFAVVVWGGNFVMGGNTFGATSVASISSAHTSGWQKLAGINANGTGVPTSPATGATGYMEVWQGIAAAALTAEVISVTMSGAANNNVDSGLLTVFGVSSATPYTAEATDPNPSIPSTAISFDSHAVSPGPNALATTNITTNNAADLLISLFGNINIA